MTPGVPLAEFTRRDVRTGRQVVESLHLGVLVVTGPDGEVVAALGEPRDPVYVRSSAKPFQSAACLALLDGDLPASDEIAVSWASHRGEERQLDAVRTLLARSGTAPEDLTCPPAVAPAQPFRRPERLLHNCSGKHALFALAGRQIGCPTDRLLDPDGPLQKHVLAELRQNFGDPTAIAVDGCGAPAVAVPLVGLARGFASLVREPRYAAVREAGLAHPGLVGGEGRLESALLAAGVVSKPGAEAVVGVGWTDTDGRAFGLGAKGLDGNGRGPAAAVSALLETAGIVPPETWRPPRPLGGGLPAGEVHVTDEVLAMAGRLVGTGSG